MATATNALSDLPPLRSSSETSLVTDTPANTPMAGGGPSGFTRSSIASASAVLLQSDMLGSAAVSISAPLATRVDSSEFQRSGSEYFDDSASSSPTAASKLLGDSAVLSEVSLLSAKPSLARAASLTSASASVSKRIFPSKPIAGSPASSPSAHPRSIPLRTVSGADASPFVYRTELDGARAEITALTAMFNKVLEISGLSEATVRDLLPEAVVAGRKLSTEAHATEIAHETTDRVSHDADSRERKGSASKEEALAHLPATNSGLAASLSMDKLKAERAQTVLTRAQEQFNRKCEGLKRDIEKLEKEKAELQKLLTQEQSTTAALRKTLHQHSKKT